MKQGNVIFVDEPHPFLAKRLNDLGFQCDFHYQSSREAILAVLSNYDGLVIRSRLEVDEELLQAGSRLKFVARLGVGVEHIDLECAARRGVRVLTSPEGSRDTVGEHTLGLLLMLLNKLGKAEREIRAGMWLREPNRGVEIKGKTIGIIGYGNMGTAFAQRLQGFEARVLAYDKFKQGFSDAYAEEASLERLFEEADIVSLHIPFLPENYHFVNDEFIRNFQKSLYLLNTARGTVLDTAALVQHLKTGKVAGAALDVLEYEEMAFSKLDLSSLPAPFQYLREAANVVLSPHIAGWSRESKEGHARVLAQKIEDL